MAGIFGNHPVDRWMEQQLNNYLYSGGECDWCGFEAADDEWLYSDEHDEFVCPHCDNGIGTLKEFWEQAHTSTWVDFREWIQKKYKI